MKYYFLLTLSVFLYNCASQDTEDKNESYSNNTDKNKEIQAGSATEQFIKNVDASEFKNLVESGNGIILDVRTPSEFESSHINNASNINIADPDFINKINLISSDKEIYVYCASGGRSARAADIMKNNGFSKIYNLSNGIISWKSNNYEVISSVKNTDNKITTFGLDDFNTLINSNKLVLIDFHTQWCAPCKKMAPIIDKLETEFNTKVNTKRVDMDQSIEVGKKYNIRGVPVFIIFKNGKEIWRHNGIIEESELRKQINNNL